jgi:hypothetical protein
MLPVDQILVKMWAAEWFRACNAVANFWLVPFGVAL